MAAFPDQNTKKQFHEMSFGGKLGYIWTYYKYPIIGALIILTLVGYAIWKNAVSDKKEIIADVVVVSSLQPENDLFDRLVPQLGYNAAGERYGVVESFDLDPENLSAADQQWQYVSVMFLMRDVDVFAAEERVFASYARSGVFLSPEQYLSPEILEKYAERAYYYTDDETGEQYLCGFRLTKDTPLFVEGYIRGAYVIGAAANSDDYTANARLILALLGEDPADCAGYIVPGDESIYQDS